MVARRKNSEKITLVQELSYKIVLVVKPKLIENR